MFGLYKINLSSFPAILLFCSFALLLFCSFALLLFCSFALLLFCSFALLLGSLVLVIFSTKGYNERLRIFVVKYHVVKTLFLSTQ
jgi:hypothetical protein